MLYDYHYNDMIERQAWISEAEGLGYRMVSDTFDDPNWKPGDPKVGTLVFTDELKPPIIPDPPKSTHFAKVTGFNVGTIRPLSVVRTWMNHDYNDDCFVTQDIVDAFQTGKLNIGDYVLVHFDDNGQQIAMMKIFKTW